MRASGRRSGAAITVAVVMSIGASGCLPAPGTIERASVSSAGQQAARGVGPLNTAYPKVSGNGRFVAFSSRSNDLVVGDGPRGRYEFLDADVFVRDLWTRKTELISVTPTGAPADWPSAVSDMSADGRYVLFNSAASNLTGTVDRDGEDDAFIRDRTTGRTTFVSPSQEWAEGTGKTQAWAMSDDARFVLLSTNDPAVADGRPATLVLDRSTGAWSQLPEADWDGLTLSDDGSTVAYRALLTDPASGKQYHRQQVWDRATGSVQSLGPIELATPFPDAGLNQSMPAISDDGDTVLWTRTRADAVPGDGSVDDDVLQWRRSTGEVTVVTPQLDTGGAVDWMCACHVDISGDGRWAIARASYAPKVPGDRPIPYAVVVWKLDGTEVHHVGRTAEHVGDVAPYRPALSDDGRIAAFTATTATLVADDTNGMPDVFAWARPG